MLKLLFDITCKPEFIEGLSFPLGAAPKIPAPLVDP